MNQNMKRTRGTGNPGAARELTQAKRTLALGRARGESGTLARVLASHSQQRAELIEFDAALVATSFADEAAVAETAALAEQALSRALAAVFPAAPIAAPVAALSLNALRDAKSLTLKALAERIGLSVDVVSMLTKGQIAASSVPARLVRALAETLDTAAEQITAALRATPALAPALQRSRGGERNEADTSTPPTQLSFAEAVRLSPGMSQAQKDAWLAEG